MDGLGAALQQLGGPWAVLIVAGFVALHVSGALRWLITRPVSVRQQLMQETQQLFDNMRREINDGRDRIGDLEARNEVLDQRNDLLTRDAGRWRHAAAAFAAKLQAARSFIRRSGLTPPPIENLDSLFELKEAEGGTEFLAQCERLFLDPNP